MTDSDSNVQLHNSHLDVATIRPIQSAEAEQLADQEYRRFLELMHSLTGEDWLQPTDCTEWNVHQILAHQVGHGEAWASFPQMVHQLRLGGPIARRKGRQLVDGQNEVQVRERQHFSPTELIGQLEAVRPRAVKGRTRRRWMRPFKFNTPGIGPTSFGKLYDVILTRDTWIHRVDVTRATGKAMHLTTAHDGRIIQDLVADWARLHRQPFTLDLTGPAGGRFRNGAESEAGPHFDLDAVEFARILSGRARGEGLLAQPVLF